MRGHQLNQGGIEDDFKSTCYTHAGGQTKRCGETPDRRKLPASAGFPAVDLGKASCLPGGRIFIKKTWGER